MEAQVPVEPMGSMLFKGTYVHLHVDGAELWLELPKLTIEKLRIPEPFLTA